MTEVEVRGSTRDVATATWLRRMAVVVVGLIVALGIWTSTVFPGEEGADLLSGPAFFLVAAFLVLKVPENRISWVLLAIALGFGLGGLYRVGVEWSEVLSFAGLFVLVLPGLGVFLPAWFPTGYPPSKGWRWLSGVAYSSAALMAVSIAMGLVLGDFDDDLGTCLSPSSCVELTAIVVTLIGVLLAVISLFLRFFTSLGVERQQMKLMALSFGLFFVGTSLQFGGLQGNVAAEVAFGVGTLTIPLALAVAISRYRLYDIDRIISRTVAYGIVVLVLGAVFAIGVGMLPQVLMGSGSAPPLLIAASTLLVAALFNPLRRRVQAWVDRRFNRAKYDAERVMDEFVGSLRGQTDEGQVIDGWVAVVSETMQPGALGVWVRG